MLHKIQKATHSIVIITLHKKMISTNKYLKLPTSKKLDKHRSITMSEVNLKTAVDVKKLKTGNLSSGKEKTITRKLKKLSLTRSLDIPQRRLSHKKRQNNNYFLGGSSS